MSLPEFVTENVRVPDGAVAAESVQAVADESTLSAPVPTAEAPAGSFATQPAANGRTRAAHATAHRAERGMGVLRDGRAGGAGERVRRGRRPGPGRAAARGPGCPTSPRRPTRSRASTR